MQVSRKAVSVCLCSGHLSGVLHLLRHSDFEHGQHVEDDVLHADAQSQTGLLHGRVCTLDAAAAVEAVEGTGQINDKAVDAAG